MRQRDFPKHAAASTAVRDAANDVFAFMDMHENFAGHIARPSPAILAGTMKAALDADTENREGSVI